MYFLFIEIEVNSNMLLHINFSLMVDGVRRQTQYRYQALRSFLPHVIQTKFS